jgi:uncharacterized Zn-finger protein
VHTIDIKLNFLLISDKPSKALSVASLTETQTETSGGEDYIYVEVMGMRKPACPLCRKVFSGRTDVERHMRVHSGSRPFTCKYCGRGFAQKGNLQRHLITHME